MNGTQLHTALHDGTRIFRGLGAGLHLIQDAPPQAWQEFLDYGANRIVHQADILAFRFKLAGDLAELRALAHAGPKTASQENTHI